MGMKCPFYDHIKNQPRPRPRKMVFRGSVAFFWSFVFGTFCISWERRACDMRKL